MSGIDPQTLRLHLMLLNDAQRMNAYRQAITAVVKDGDVVLDVGTGTGILALFACQAGAKKVYAVDHGDILTVARELADANDFRRRVVFLNDDVRHIRLDEQVDVITSELMSKACIGQNMAQLISFCRDAFLRSGGRIVPDVVELLIAPIESEHIYAQCLPPSPTQYNLNFSSLERLAVNRPVSARIPSSALLTAAETVYRYRAAAASEPDQFRATLRFNPAADRVVHGFAVWFSAVLAENVRLTNAPPGICSWDNMFLPLSKPVHLSPDMWIELTLQGRSDSHLQDFWAWQTTFRSSLGIVSESRQSSFSGALLSKDMLERASSSWKPSANRGAKLIRFVLERMNGTLPVHEIAAEARREFGDYFGSDQQAMDNVREIIQRYSD